MQKQFEPLASRVTRLGPALTSLALIALSIALAACGSGNGGGSGY